MPKGGSDAVTGSRLQVERYFAGLIVERHGIMLVRDHPLVVHLAEAHRSTPPHVEILAVLFRSAHVVEAVREGGVAVGRDSEVVQLEIEITRK